MLQVKEAPLDEWPSSELCEDGVMKVDPWPYITNAALFENYVECPLSGGYNMKIYDKAKKLGVCDAVDGETRLESECMEGEGMYFRFRHANCVPDGLRMHKSQRVYCIAKWSEGTIHLQYFNMIELTTDGVLDTERIQARHLLLIYFRMSTVIWSLFRSQPLTIYSWN